MIRQANGTDAPALRNECVQFEVTSNQKRKNAHRFYQREGLEQTHVKLTESLSSVGKFYEAVASLRKICYNHAERRVQGTAERCSHCGYIGR